MAAFPFTVQQVNFSSEDFPFDSSSVDSLSSVVDPNVDFVMECESNLVEKETANVTEEWKTSTSRFQLGIENDSMDQVPKCIVSSQKSTHSYPDGECCNIIKTTYPTIPLEVAQYINEKNPEIRQEAEKCFNSAANACFTDSAQSPTHSIISSSPLHSLSIATEALALQHSVIGNLGVKPVSADIVAQVVANTKLRMEKGDLKYGTQSSSCESILHEKVMNNGSVMSETAESHSKIELIRYPASSISSTVEKRSWFSNSSFDSTSDSVAKNTPKGSTKDSFLNSRTSSQSSINSLSVRKNYRSNESDMPKVHTRNSISKIPKGEKIDSPYEQDLDSSVDYETESSISEKFEIESLCSEIFETESNFSEISGVDDEMFQIRKTQSSKSSSSNAFNQNKSSYNFQEPKNHHAVVKNLSLSNSLLATAEKATETVDEYNFLLLREKATLEGRLESVSKDQNDLVKERDNFRSLSISYEARLKSFEAQLNAAMIEKKAALQQLNSQTKEQKNWDNVIKEYQSIIESKNSEIKGLKDDLSESEQANTRTKISFEELKVEMESKDGAVSGLKKKIAELHVEVQVLIQEKIQFENEVKNIRLEMETMKKSKEWFQEQLHSTQENRNQLHQELILTQSNLGTVSNNLEKVISEKTQLRHELIHVQQRAVTEKEVLMKRLETIEADMKERESLFDEIQNDKGTAESVLVERIRKIEEEKSHLMNQVFTLSDQQYDLASLKTDCEEKEKNIKVLEKEKAELRKQVAILQKTANDKDMNVQRLLQDIKDKDVKLNHVIMSLAHAEELITTLKEERTAADVALASANEEKRAVNESLKSVGENVNKLKHNFKHMKAELVSKTSQAEQLMKEKQSLEENVKRCEDSILFLKKEFEQKAHSENQNRDVMFDDLKKSKNDVQSVLNVYSKDLLNYQQIAENLSQQKDELSREVSDLKSFIESEKSKMSFLSEENFILKRKMDELEKCRYYQDKMIIQPEKNHSCSAEENKQKSQKSTKILYKKLKEKIRECEFLRNELEVIKKNQASVDHIQSNSSSEFMAFHDKAEDNEKLVQLETELLKFKKLLEDQSLVLKKSEETILELEREKGKRIGFEDKYESAKQRLSEVEALLSEKDSQVMQLNCHIEQLVVQLTELDSSLKNQIASLETDLNKEKALVKSLRQQVFQEKRANSHAKREILLMKSALEQANQISDSKKQEIETIQAELSVKVQAELKHRTEIEHFQTEIRLQHSIVEKLNKELEEVKARDPALAEQIKLELKGKTNEVSALKEKLTLMDERHSVEVDNLKKILESIENERETIKLELSRTREEKFSYQAKVIELRKALRSKLAELESKGILRIDNKTCSNGPVIQLNIPDPEVSFDEAYVNSLLQKSMHLSESRPLSNLQECLDSLKQEMVELQKKIMDSAEKT